jgi:toxin ParE1/3/4
LLTAIDTLEYYPERHSLAPESEVAATEVRQMLFGVYRVLYEIENDVVNVLTVRHGARRFLEPGELLGDS